MISMPIVQPKEHLLCLFVNNNASKIRTLQNDGIGFEDYYLFTTFVVIKLEPEIPNSSMFVKH